MTPTTLHSTRSRPRRITLAAAAAMAGLFVLAQPGTAIAADAPGTSEDDSATTTVLVPAEAAGKRVGEDGATADRTMTNAASPRSTAPGSGAGSEASADDQAPQASDPADQAWVTRTWHALLDKITGYDGGTDSSDGARVPTGEEDGDGPGDADSDAEDVPVVASLPVTANNTALTAEGLINSVGVGTHLAYLDTSYGDVDTVKLVEDLGVLHVRDGLGSTDSTPIKSMQRLGAAGVDINWVSQPASSSFSIDDQLKLIKDNKLDVTSVEGENERDNHGDAGWVSEVREHQTKLYSAVKDTLGDDVAVVAPSLVHDESRAELGKVPSDVANSHPYTGGEMQTPEQTEHQLSMAKEVTPDVDTTTPAQVKGKKIDLKTAVEDSGAMWATETGFHTATDSTAGNGVQPHVSEKAQAVLETQQVLANYANGVDRTYIYELMDEGDDNAQAEDRFGLAHADGSPKPVYTALQQLLATVKAGGPAGLAGTAGAAPVTVDVSGGSEVTTHVVLPRADGSTVVAVWEASPVWDRDASKDLNVPAKDVTLTLGGDADAQVFVPGQGTKALDSQDGTSTVTVSSQAAPTIIVLAPTGTSSDDKGGSDDETTPETSEPTPSATSTATPTTSPTATPTGSEKPHPLQTAGPKVDSSSE